MANNEEVWVIAHINRGFIPLVEEELAQYDYEDVEAYIPTVRVLKKNFKNKAEFEFVPLLFNYGFFKIPFEKACQIEYLSLLRQRITCIYGWVKDPIKTIHTRPRLRLDNGNLIDALPKAAIATDEEVARMVEATQSMSIFNKDDLERIKPGDYLTLKGYPFENMPAEVIKINHRKREVKVKLLMDAIVQQVTVSFENVFYSIYKDFKEEGKEKSSDEIDLKFGYNSTEKMTFKFDYDGQ